MNRQLTELKKISDRLFAEWERTHSQATMNHWLWINDAIMAIVKETLEGQ